MKHILKCRECNLYTLMDNCPKCKGKTTLPKPPKYSPEDKYSRFRRMVKEKDLSEKGLI